MKKTLPDPLVWCSWCHEPIQFYLRRSASPASVVGAGRWIPAWYDRIHTKEALKRAADLGGTLSVTTEPRFGLTVRVPSPEA